VLQAGYDRFCCCIDQLGCDAQAIPALVDAPFQHVADAQLGADSPCVGSFVFVSEARITGDHKHCLETGKCRRDLFDNTVGEILLFRVAAHILKGENGN
jgi:hypothetical protein